MLLVSPVICAQQQSVYVELSCNDPSTLIVSPTNLKFDKTLAFSFAFDDGLDDAYDLGFHLFNGGYSEAGDKSFPGLFYSDGCGNQIPFSATLSWYTANQANTDLHHLPSPGYMSWNQAIEMYTAGWDLINHSYNHAAGTQDIDYLDQLQRNRSAIENRLGNLVHYVVPPGGDTNYIPFAFLDGAYAVFTSQAGSTSNGNDPVDVSEPLNGHQPIFWRRFIASDKYTIDELKTAASELVNDSSKDQPLWWNEFTHRVAYNYVNGSVRFEEFEEYFNYLEQEFGAKGKDNVWFAGAVEVFEYLLVRDLVNINHTVTDGQMIIEIDYSDIPSGLRYHDISLFVETNQVIELASLRPEGELTYAQQSGGYLLNIRLPNQALSGQKYKKKTALKLQVYPNPAQTMLTVQLNETSSQVDIELYSSSGIPVATWKYDQMADQKTLVLDRTRIPAGMYILCVRNHIGLLGRQKIFIH